MTVQGENVDKFYKVLRGCYNLNEQGFEKDKKEGSGELHREAILWTLELSV